MKSLIVAEKPSVAMAIKPATEDKFVKKDGYLEGEKFIITWAYGHLLDAAPPEFYDKKWKSWKLETLPIIIDEMKFVPIPGGKRQLETIKKLILRRDVSRIINAGDPGREGELIQRLIYRYCRANKPVLRLWINSLEVSEIKRGLRELTPQSDFDNLYYSALSRKIADWLVGINLSRAVTLKIGAGNIYSLGRVQEPVLSMIVKREEERRNFKKEKYYKVIFEISGLTFTSKGMKREEAERIIKGGGKVEIKEIKEKQKRISSPLPHSLTSLQKEANEEFKFSAKKTLLIAQSLYEKKIITYPRTDTRYLPKNMFMKVKNILKKLGYEIDKINTKPFNDAKLTDHFAIIPTGERGEMDDNERKIYDLVLKKFLASLMHASFYRVLHSKAVFKGEEFTHTSSYLRDEGWEKVYGKKREKFINPLKKGEYVPENLRIKEFETEPPPRFTDGSMVKLMEKIGLGTAATRAEIVEKLVKRKFIFRKKGNLIPTRKGFILIEFLERCNVKSIIDPELTSFWEAHLEAIKEGKEKKEKFIKKVKEFVISSVDKILEFKDYNRFLEMNVRFKEENVKRRRRRIRKNAKNKSSVF